LACAYQNIALQAYNIRDTIDLVYLYQQIWQRLLHMIRN